GGDPIGAALAIVVLDAATIVLIFFAARSTRGSTGGLAAAALYATAGAAVSLAPAFSNPRVLPFFSPLLFFSITRVIRGDACFLAVVFGAGAAAWQVHDQAVLLLVWAAIVLTLFRPRLSWRAVLVACLIGFLFIVPFLWYEAQHNLVNVRAMLSYITSS